VRSSIFLASSLNFDTAVTLSVISIGSWHFNPMGQPKVLLNRATDAVYKEPGKLELVFTPKNGGAEQRLEVFQFEGPGQALAM
jgi:hypothetical protein